MRKDILPQQTEGSRKLQHHYKGSAQGLQVPEINGVTATSQTSSPLSQEFKA